MRSISKRALAALAITAAVVALTAASASAAEPHYAQWWVNGAQFTGTSSTETSVSKSIVITMTLGSNVKTEVVCSGGSGAGTIAETDKGTVSPGLELTGCKVPVPSGCEISSTLKTGALNVALDSESGLMYTTVGGAQRL